MKKSTKTLSLLLTVAVAAGSMTACTKKETEKSADDTITWMGSYAVGVEKNSTTEKYLEEKYNVKIDAISNTTNYSQKLGAMIAAGNVPDLMFFNEPDMWVPLAKQGILAEIDIKDVEKYAPGYYKLINKLDSNLWKVCKQNGKMYTIPRYTGREGTVNAIWRKDWMDKVGVDKVPVTLEEYENLLLKFRNEDPDGNGKKDTYGMSSYGKQGEKFFDMIFGAFGVIPGQWKLGENGKIVAGAVDSKAKEALELLHRWYEEEIIDPEFITDDVSSVAQKYASGRTGVHFDGATKYTELTAAGVEILNSWKQRKPEAEFAFGNIPEGKNGEFGVFLWGPRTHFVGFGKQVKETPEKMQKSLTMLNDMLTNEEVALKVAWGEKGKTYDFIDPAKGAEGGLKYLPPYDTDANARAKEGIGVESFFNLLEPLSYWAVEDIADKYSPDVTEYVSEKTLNNSNYRDAIYRANLPSATLYNSNLEKIRLTEYCKFITGERSLDEWDKFVDEYMKAGGDKLTKEAQEYYDKNVK